MGALPLVPQDLSVSAAYFRERIPGSLGVLGIWPGLWREWDSGRHGSNTKESGREKKLLNSSSQGLVLKPATKPTSPKPSQAPLSAPDLKTTWLYQTTLAHLIKPPSCLGGLVLLLIFQGLLFCFSEVGSHCSPGWLQTGHIAADNLKP